MGLLNEVPSNVARAFYGYHEWEVEAFASRWGGLHTEVFIRVLAEGQVDDKAFAIFAIGYLDTPWAREQMRSFLESPVRKERWASALSLGAGHDEDAIPYLERVLLDGLDPTEQFSSPEEEGWYAVQRDNAARLLTSWAPATVVPILRQAFLTVEALREARPSSDDYLFDYQDTLAYALGHYGAVAALTGIALTKTQRKVAMSYLALGILRAEERYQDIDTAMITNKRLQQEVAEVLEQQFGLAERERQDVITNFWKDHRRRTEEVRRSTEEDTDECASEAEHEELIA